MLFASRTNRQTIFSYDVILFRHDDKDVSTWVFSLNLPFSLLLTSKKSINISLHCFNIREDIYRESRYKTREEGIVVVFDRGP